MYILDNEIEIPNPGLSFNIIYQSRSPAAIKLYNKGKQVFTVVLPESENEVEYAISLPARIIFTGFQIESDYSDNDFLIKEIAIKDSYNGIRFNSVPVIGSGFRLTKTNNINTSYTIGLPEISNESDKIAGSLQILLEYEYNGTLFDSSEKHIIIKCSSVSGESKSFSLTPSPGNGKIYIYEASCGFRPHSLEIKSELNAFSLTQLELKNINDIDTPEFTAISADFGIILSYKKSYWRKDDFELFNWNRFPDILIFDTANYEIQSSFFKRLAFFIEKKNFAGTLMKRDEFEDLHGWNAHDFSSDSLSLFFNTAEETGFQLNENEKLLRTILLNNHIIGRSDSGYTSIKGGVISISRASSDRLRHIFLTHEGYHGIFFSNQNYVNDVFEIWGSLSDFEQEFWKVYFDWKDYNRNDYYLVVNEFQSYLMQQPIEAANNHFSISIMEQILRDEPKHLADFDYLNLKYPETFSNSAIRVEKSAYLNTGAKAGNLNCLSVIVPE